MNGNELSNKKTETGHTDTQHSLYTNVDETFYVNPK